ncbi:hypothetical protein F1748_25295 (plasmid) [Escherichia coli]|nr:hypothetical protein F1748_25295 [Escherichia coli]
MSAIRSLLRKSSYAVEDGTTMSDHAVIKDKSVSFTGIITSSPHIIRKENYIDRNTDPDNPVNLCALLPLFRHLWK